MKKSKLLIFVFLMSLCLLLFGSTNLKIKADTVLTSDNITLDGAQIRTTDPMALRFVGNVSGYVAPENRTIAKYGILLAQGKVSNSEGFVKGGTLNEYNIIFGECDSINDQNQFRVNLINIPEDKYIQDISARAYVELDDGTLVYGNKIISRSLVEVALNAKNNGEDNEAITNILTYFDNNYVLTDINFKGNFEIKDNLIELNCFNLEKEFLKDWNKLFNTSLTDLSLAKDGDSFYKCAAVGIKRCDPDELCAKTYDNVKDSNMSKFFITNPKTSAKWKWLLEFFNNEIKLGVHPGRQVKALLSPNGFSLDSYGATINEFKHLCGTIAGFFHNDNVQIGGMVPVNFSNPDLYNKLNNYATISIDINNYKVLKLNEKVLLPESKAPQKGYEWDGYYLGSTKYNVGDEIVATNEAKEFVATYKEIIYNINYKDIDGDITSLNATYTVNDKIELPQYEKEGYIFGGWYDNQECTGDSIIRIDKGSIGNKTFYAKLEEVVGYTIEYNFNGGNTKYQTMDEVIDAFLTDYNAYSGKTYTREQYKTLGSWSEIGPATTFLYSKEYREKWAFLISYFAEVASPANKPAYKAFNKYNSQSELTTENNNYIYEIAYELRAWVGQYKYEKNASYITTDYSDPALHAPLFNSLSNFEENEFNNQSGTITLIDTVYKPGYTFDGWYTTVDFKEGTKVTQVNSEATLYAKWVEQNP